MKDRNLARGVVLSGIALAFGLGALKYPIGHLNQTGPGLFPLLVSSVLLLLGVATIVQSFFTERVRVGFTLKNIVIILSSLCGFAVITERVNMIAGIIFLVFCAMLAASPYSLKRNAAIAGVLIAIAVAFYKLLGVQLPLY
ncbi:MAG TPA: tripartite tricarboxylate transporter TctB family protein [Burkholderiales bacterium]|nr:tripartite tricarboxylate transporter TctB family protein [Burkholderiales bacterium]